MKNVRLLLERQHIHLGILAVLLAGISIVVKTGKLMDGQILGIDTVTWFVLAIAIAVLHQVYVLFCWRVQLHYSLITRLFGWNGFTYYSTGFFILAILRIIFVILLAVSSRNTLPVDQFILNIMALAVTLPAVYLFYSIGRFFPYNRAVGIDHFDMSYRNKPFVKKGIFKYFKNPMYIFGIAILLIPGLLYSSGAALLVALFSQVYIWVHYYTTERPDMKRIYGTG